MGHSWNEIPKDFLLELLEIYSVQKLEISKDHIKRFINLLTEIDNAPSDETPGQLEKRLAKSNILPKTYKYKRYGILQTLAVIGVLPTRAENDHQPARSDIVLPLAGWSGKFGVDFDKAKHVFKLDLSKAVF